MDNEQNNQPGFAAPGGEPEPVNPPAATPQSPAGAPTSGYTEPTAPVTGYPQTPGYPMPAQGNWQAAPQPGYRNDYRPGFDPRTGTWSNSKPGIIAIRPQTWSELVGASFKILRYNFSACIGLVSSVVGVVLVGILVIGVGGAALFGSKLFEADHSYSSSQSTDALSGLVGMDFNPAASLPSALLYFALYFIFTFIACLLFSSFAHVVLDAAAGRKSKLREGWREVMLNKGAVAKVAAICALVISALSLISSFLSASFEDSFDVLLFLVSIVFGIISAVLYVKLGHALIVASAEHRDFANSMRRGWHISDGLMGKSLGVMITVGMLVYWIIVLSIAIFTTIAFLAFIGAASAATPNYGLIIVLLVVAVMIISILSAFAVIPSLSAVVLLYIDGLFRNEGGDIAWLHNLAAEPGNGSLGNWPSGPTPPYQHP